MSELRGDQLHAKLSALHQAYKEAIGEHELGKALCLVEEAGKLLVCNWEQVLSALDMWSHPLSHGTEDFERQQDEIPY